MKQTRFYIMTAERPYEEVTYALKLCRKPQRTLVYKKLLNMLNRDEIISFGYQIAD